MNARVTFAPPRSWFLDGQCRARLHLICRPALLAGAASGQILTLAPRRPRAAPKVIFIVSTGQHADDNS